MLLRLEPMLKLLVQVSRDLGLSIDMPMIPNQGLPSEPSVLWFDPVVCGQSVTRTTALGRDARSIDAPAGTVVIR